MVPRAAPSRAQASAQGQEGQDCPERAVPASLLRDLPALLVLVLSLAANAALIGYLKSRLASLPELLPLHFNAYGEVDRIGERWEIYRLPLIGLVVLTLNVTLAVLPPGRAWPRWRFLLAVALLVQGLLWLAALRITGTLG